MSAEYFLSRDHDKGELERVANQAATEFDPGEGMAAMPARSGSWSIGIRTFSRKLGYIGQAAPGSRYGEAVSQFTLEFERILSIRRPSPGSANGLRVVRPDWRCAGDPSWGGYALTKWRESGPILPRRPGRPSRLTIAPAGKSSDTYHRVLPRWQDPGRRERRWPVVFGIRRQEKKHGASASLPSQVSVGRLFSGWEIIRCRRGSN